METNSVVTDVMEQLDAVKDIIHHYTCVSCQIATAQTPVIIVSDIPGGTRITVVGVCNTCKEMDEGKTYTN